MSTSKAINEHDMSLAMSVDEAWKKQAGAALRALAAPETETSKAARFRELMPEVEAAMARSVNQADIVAALAASGLVMTVDELRNALYRERKRRKGKPSETSQTQPPAAPAPAAEPKQTLRGDFRQQRDKPLNW